MTKKGATVLEPREISDVQMAFPTSVKDFLPDYADVPEEFKDWQGNEYLDFISAWFFTGADASRLVAREGVDRDKALRHIRYCLGSREPKHEHKHAGCAYLLAQWFTIKPEGAP
jgi:hypothetical protein